MRRVQEYISKSFKSKTKSPTMSKPCCILLGVTGSVAAVKAPELAVQLVEELGAQVRILLTEGGKNFWGKASQYDAEAWAKLQRFDIQILGTVRPDL
jgi:hypothetical protein